MSITIIDLTQINYKEPPISTLIILTIGLAVFYVLHRLTGSNSAQSNQRIEELKEKSVKTSTKKRFEKPKFEPVSANFNWETLEVCKHYPFKDAEYKLNMGISNLNPSDWLVIDPTYKQKLTAKNLIVNNKHPDYPQEKDLKSNTVFFLPEATAAVKEFYNYIMEYYCQTYPQCFVEIDENLILNKIMGIKMPKTTDDVTNPEDYLYHLVNVMEEDFIILLKDPSKENEVDGTEYYFKAGIFAFAAGFNPRDRFDAPLSFIHHPIPGYEQKLKVSMNKFFNNIQPYQFVTRANFSVQNHDKFYVDDENKGHNLAKGEIQQPFKKEDLDFVKKVHYRSERQALTKLPETGAIIFTIRTLLMPMVELKKEPMEVRDRFAGAVTKLPDDIANYKRAKEWGPAVVSYLQEA